MLFSLGLSLADYILLCKKSKLLRSTPKLGGFIMACIDFDLCEFSFVPKLLLVLRELENSLYLS